MKYKIGNAEVEAVQWKGFNVSGISKIAINYRIDRYTTDGNFQRIFVDNIELRIGDYLIKSEESLFKLSEKDFNNMAVKVKEPKFKVGDRVYWLSEDCEGLSVDRVLIQEIISDKDLGIIYDVGAQHMVKEKYLLTLEEAIEKLKEL